MITYKNWTTDEENELRRLVAMGTYSYRQIGGLMGRSIHSITSHARQYLDIHNSQYEARKYQYTHDFFKEPNVINSYIAGFLAADGNLLETASGSFRLRLEIHSNDILHLDWIKQQLGHEGPTKSWGGKNTHFWEMFVSPEYAAHLEKNFGVTPNKAHRLQPPDLKDFSLQFAYLLGLLDGDGCVHINTQNSLSVGYVSCSFEAVLWAQSAINALDFPVIRQKPNPSIFPIRENAKGIVYAGARAVCLVQLAQEFARRTDLPILTRKWGSEKVTGYISDFYLRHGSFHFDPVQKLDSLLKSSSFSCISKH
jgi:DNA-binding CsgD family transcriptional regulator